MLQTVHVAPPGAEPAAAPGARAGIEPDTGARPPTPGLWSRILFAVLRPVARGRPRARCLALLATELVGLPEEGALHDTARALTAHDRVLLPAIRAYQGRRITARGAWALAAFPSPTDAVLCGIGIQDLVAARNGGVAEGERFAIRLAVHLGESRFRRGRMVGAPVDVARALCGVAARGEVWLTRSVHLAMNHVEVTVEPLMPVAVGGGIEPVRVYRARRTRDKLAGVQAAGATVETGWLERVLEPVSDAMASIEEGAAEGRAWATLRVACAAAAMAALGMAALVLQGAQAGCALTASLARRRGGRSPKVDWLTRRVSAGLAWIRSRRSIPRAALIRPLW